MSLHGQVGPQIIAFLCVQRACRNLLSSLGRLWVSCHHCFIVLGHVSCFYRVVLLIIKQACSVLWLSKPAF